MKGQSNGQAALILIMVMAVVSAVSVGLASRQVENLRSQEINNISSQAQNAANAALEIALLKKGVVDSTVIPGSGGVSYSATYEESGEDGFVTNDLVEEGDVVQVKLDGAVGTTGINVYWSGDTAVMVSVLSGDTSGSYSTSRYTADSNLTRSGNNKFDAITAESYDFKSVNFDKSLTIPIDLNASPPPKILRLLLLYGASKIGVEPSPTGSTLSDQVAVITATGTAGGNIVSRSSLEKFAQKVPAVFENVLYTNNNLVQ